MGFIELSESLATELARRKTEAPQARRDTSTFTLHCKDWAALQREAC
jgi:hypothetical protein